MIEEIKYYEGFDMGAVTESPARTVSKLDFLAFRALLEDRDIPHSSEAYKPADDAYTKGLSNVMLLAYGIGFLYLSGFEGKTIALIGFLGINDLHFNAPVEPGMTIRMRRTTVAKRETSKRDRGIVTFHVEILDEFNNALIDMKQSLMYYRDPAGMDK